MKIFGQVLMMLALFLPISCSGVESSECRALNKQVIAYAESKTGQTVGRGECWDLVQAALDHHNATWKRPSGFGKRLGSDDSPEIGDIIQFENARIEWRRGNRWGSMSLGIPRHTAIINEVRGSELGLIHQNVQGVRRVVTGTRIDLKDIVSGSYAIFRPVRCSD